MKPHVVTPLTPRRRALVTGGAGFIGSHVTEALLADGWEVFVLDNLSTHTASALYETFEPAEARRILRRLEFHYTPKHASWLNMVEIEIGVMVAQCLDRRIPTMAMLVREVKGWERARNRDKARIKWLFTLDRAREKLGRAYLSVRPKPATRAAA